MLVRKAWATLSVGLIYEAMVVNHYDVGRVNEIVATLQHSPNSAQLACWVKRIDIWESVETKCRVRLSAR